MVYVIFLSFFKENARDKKPQNLIKILSALV